LYARKLNDFLEQAVGINQQWKLCYRASVDGWAAVKFHEGCDGKPDTVTIIKVGDSVFGGYADIAWGKRIFLYVFFCTGKNSTNNLPSPKFQYYTTCLFASKTM